MIEQRRLSREELNQLIDEAPETESRNLKAYLNQVGMDAYDFFDSIGVEHFGLVDDGYPVYVAVLESSGGINSFWTVVNKSLKQPIRFCKLCRRELALWVGRHGKIYATMEKVSPLSQKWTEWLGFNKVADDGHTVTFVIGG